MRSLTSYPPLLVTVEWPVFNWALIGLTTTNECIGFDVSNGWLTCVFSASHFHTDMRPPIFVFKKEKEKVYPHFLSSSLFFYCTLINTLILIDDQSIINFTSAVKFSYSSYVAHRTQRLLSKKFLKKNVRSKMNHSLFCKQFILGHSSFLIVEMV